MKEQVVAVLGAQWGDEGKGKMVDILGSQYEICCRFNGGSNAGHTVVVEGIKYALHLLPSGILYPKTVGVIGSGVVVHFPTLLEEIRHIEKQGIAIKGRLKISDRAHVVLNVHQLIDGAIEGELGANKLGTTKRGIGPAYAEKMNRSGIRCGDLLGSVETLKAKQERIVAAARKRFGHFEYDFAAELAVLKEAAEYFGADICDSITYVHHAHAAGKRLLVEGANALMLDIDWGTYPYVTSSSPTIGGALTGLGVPLRFIEAVFGVVKAYTTRVGEGPFPSECPFGTPVGDHLGKVGREVGTTTGRARRCGWLDLVVMRYSTYINGYTALNLTKIDVLTGLGPLKVAVAYKLDGKEIDGMPANLDHLARVEVVYKELAGWNEDISKCRTLAELPQTTRDYIAFIQEFLRVPITHIGVGAGREDMIVVQ